MQKQVEAFLNYKEHFPKIISGEEKTKEQIAREQKEFMLEFEKAKTEINAEAKIKIESFLEALKFINDKYGKKYKSKVYWRWTPAHGVVIDYYVMTKAHRKDIQKYEKELKEKYLEIYKNKNNETTP